MIDRAKTAGQLAYEAAEAWIKEHDAPSSALPTWEMLDGRAREYWDRIGTAVRAPVLAALGVTDRKRPTMPCQYIRGLW